MESLYFGLWARIVLLTLFTNASNRFQVSHLEWLRFLISPSLTPQTMR